VQAEKRYGEPPKPLLSSGTVGSLTELLGKLGYANAPVVRIEPTGAERLATFLTMIAPLLLVVGIVGVYIEMKTPGFGLPGIVGIAAFVLYFLGGFIAGLSGLEWTAVFIIGLGLLMLEIFLFPGTILLGITGAMMMFVSLVMAMVDLYPGMPAIPSIDLLRVPLTNILLSSFTALVIMVVLSRFVLRTPLFHRLVSQGASGVTTVAARATSQSSKLGEVGVAISPLRPGGKAQFGAEILDVITQGEMIARGSKVKILGFSGHEAVVEAQAG
jgi:membrane-bound serine protease (ClpP class)